jgi:phosphatidylglycerol lysyltransferase
MSKAERKKKGWLHRLIPLVMIAVFCAAIWALERELSNFSWSRFVDFLSELSALQISLAFGMTAVAYAAMTAYDWFALRYLKLEMATWKVALAAFVGYAFSMNVGQTLISGGAVRLRLYSTWGLGPGDITGIVGFNFFIGMIGQMLISGALFVTVGIKVPNELPIPLSSATWIGWALLIGVAVFFVLIFQKRESVRIGKWRLDLPTPAISIAAVLISALDWALAGAVLFVLFPADSGVGVSQLIAIVMMAHIVAVLSTVPGGLGVFETVVILLLPPTIPKAEALAGLIAFRTIFYLIPFLVAILLFGGQQIVASRKRVH